MNMDHFRAQLMANAEIHGGMGRAMLTQKSIDKTEEEIANNARLNKIIDEAVKTGTIKTDDKLFLFLKSFFVMQANTIEGKERALGMAILTTTSINKEFKVEKR